MVDVQILGAGGACNIPDLSWWSVMVVGVNICKLSQECPNLVFFLTLQALRSF